MEATELHSRFLHASKTVATSYGFNCKLADFLGIPILSGHKWCEMHGQCFNGKKGLRACSFGIKWFLWLVWPAVVVHASCEPPNRSYSAEYVIAHKNCGLATDAGEDTGLNLRALSDAPHGYAPSEVECPTSVPSVRSAAKLSPSELNWLGLRRQKTF